MNTFFEQISINKNGENWQYFHGNKKNWSISSNNQVLIVRCQIFKFPSSELSSFPSTFSHITIFSRITFRGGGCAKRLLYPISISLNCNHPSFLEFCREKFHHFLVNPSQCTSNIPSRYQTKFIRHVTSLWGKAVFVALFSSEQATCLFLKLNETQKMI